MQNSDWSAFCIFWPFTTSKRLSVAGSFLCAHVPLSTDTALPLHGLAVLASVHHIYTGALTGGENWYNGIRFHRRSLWWPPSLLLSVCSTWGTFQLCTWNLYSDRSVYTTLFSSFIMSLCCNHTKINFATTTDTDSSRYAVTPSIPTKSTKVSVWPHLTALETLQIVPLHQQNVPSVVLWLTPFSTRNVHTLPEWSRMPHGPTRKCSARHIAIFARCVQLHSLWHAKHTPSPAAHRTPHTSLSSPPRIINITPRRNTYHL